MIVTVRNNTQFPILLDGTSFHAGSYETMPATPILPEQYITYKLDPSMFGGGTNGGNAWMVVLNKPEGAAWRFATGWVSAVFPGPNRLRAGVAESSDPNDGNRAATPKGNSITSTKTFNDKDGKNIKFIASASFDETEAAVFTLDTTPA